MFRITDIEALKKEEPQKKNPSFVELIYGISPKEKTRD